jgi:hypothetical protein
MCNTSSVIYLRKHPTLNSYDMLNVMYMFVYAFRYLLFP